MLSNKTMKAVLGLAFDKQLAFIRNKSRRKALFVARRGAKTYTIALYITLACIGNKGIKVMYLGLSKESAENALWKDCLLKIFNDVGLVEDVDYTYNKNNRTVTFSNKSTIKMTGADTSFKEPSKLLGGKYFMAVIDECQNYTNDLEDIVLSVLGPAVSDYIDKGGGQIILAGTAGPYIGKHYWYQVNNNKDCGWTVCSWDGKDNPHMKAAKEKEEADFLAQYGENYVKTDWYRQQYLCQWIEDSIDRVYTYDKTKHNLTDAVIIAKLENCLVPRMKYILATDLGSNDSTSFTLVGYQRFDPNVYVIRSEKFQGITLDRLAEKLNWYKANFDIVAWPIDSAGAIKIVVDDYRRKYGIPFSYPKSKVDKFEYQRLMNTDFVCERIKVIVANCKDLIEEWNALLWDKKALAEGYRKEADKYHNDCADSCLYAYAEAHHHRIKQEPVPEDINQQTVNKFLGNLAKKKDLLNVPRDDGFSW